MQQHTFEGRGPLNAIIRFSLKNRPLVLFATALIIVIGSLTAWKMEVDVFPDLNAPTVVVMTESRGMAAEEVERLVTFPIETAVNGATDVRRVRSSSTQGFSVVWVEFDWGTDIYRDRQIVSEKLSTVANQLPAGIGEPTLGPQSSILGEVMFIGLTADSTSLTDLRTLADWTIRPRLLATGGVAQVAVLGGDVMEYQIQADPNRMRHYGVTMDEILTAARGMNENATGGVLYESGNEYIVRGVLATTETERMGQAVVKRTPSGLPIVLADVATVTTGAKLPKTGLASVNGKPSVLLTVTKQPATGTLELTEKLDKAIEELKTSLPKDVVVNTQLYRQQDFIDASISNIQKSLIEGGIFVVLVLFLFLANSRTTLISLVTIPLSLLVTFIVLKCMDLTINTMSIGGMAIAIGSLVDDAIVDVENVYRRLRINHSLPEGERRSTISEIYHASREVRMPILNSTLIIVVSFVPLFFLSGLEGRMLVPLGVSFIVALFASTLVALTLTPVLCSYLLDPKKQLRESAEPRWVTAFKKSYINLLGKALRPRVTKGLLIGTALSVVVAISLFFTLGRSFLPPFNEGSFNIGVTTMPGISLEESNRIGQHAEDILLQIPEIRHTARKTGRAELDEHALGVNTSEIEAPYVLEERTKEELMSDIRQRLGTIPGVSVELGQPISHRIDAMLSGTKASIAIKVFGPELATLHSLGLDIQEAVKDVEGVADLTVEQQVERPQLTITPRRELMARHGITMPEFSEFVSAALGGETVSMVMDRGRKFDLTVRMKPEHIDGIEEVSNLLISTGDGKQVPLSAIADVSSTAGPNTIGRENAQRKLVVSANVQERDVRSVVEDMQKRIREKVELPEAYHIEFGGQFESEAAASRILLLLSFVSIGIILLLLYLQFRKWKQAIVVLLGLPLALIGGVVALWFTSGVVSIPAIIGFISLFGIATRGGMLLVDRYNELSREGLTVEECIRKGSKDRLLPIVMTALTSALALIPLAIGSDLPGNEIQSPMAQVMLGGLITSTLLNLFVVPIVYNRIKK